MAGKLIVFEGTDGSGKSTQFQKLCQRVTQTGREFQKLVFPQYSEPSSALIRMYLNGEFGPRPEDVRPLYHLQCGPPDGEMPPSGAGGVPPVAGRL